MNTAEVKAYRITIPAQTFDMAFYENRPVMMKDLPAIRFDAEEVEKTGEKEKQRFFVRVCQETIYYLHVEARHENEIHALSRETLGRLIDGGAELGMEEGSTYIEDIDLYEDIGEPDDWIKADLVIE